jgi:hypothetical protein
VEFKDEVVEGTTQVVEPVTKDQDEGRVYRFQIADVKAILQSATMHLGREGAECLVNPPAEFVLGDAVMLSGPSYLGCRPVEASVPHRSQR